MPTPVVTFPAGRDVLVNTAQTLTPVRQAFVQENLAVQPGITTPFYLGPGNPLTGAAVTQEVGGEPNCLDSVDPTNMQPGFCLAFLKPGAGVQRYYVETGTLPSPFPEGFVQPVNYNATTQPNYFLKG